MVQGKTLIRLKEPTLPSFRVSYHYLFENIGTDYAGPIYYKVKLDLSHKMQKCYFLSITCSSSTRTIHLEVTCDVNATSLVLALRRFISRKGIPRVIFSDNFKSFKASIVKEFCRNNFITWKFILERSPWWGGFYERLVRTVKNSLKKILGRAQLSYDEIHTIICEIENVVNCRPLTFLNENNFDESLTLYHLIFGRNIVSNISNRFDQTQCQVVYRKNSSVTTTL